MDEYLIKLERAQMIMQKMGLGVDPITGEAITEDSCLCNEKIKRCLLFVCDVLKNELHTNLMRESRKISEFSITTEEIRKVKYPDNSIGVNEFAKMVNEVIDLTRSKRLTGVDLNKQLKKMGLLSEETNSIGHKRTVLTEKSKSHGIETVKKIFEDKEYDKIVFNNAGIKYLLENLNEIMRKSE